MKYLNTSYVDIQRLYSLCGTVIPYNLNTSYVDIQREASAASMEQIENLNTSYVDIQPGKSYDYFLETLGFKYILC